ncbi:hypothetical protein [Wolbachia endosymbiont (group A) of Agelastica alni]
MLTSKLSWIPVSSTGMTPLGAGMTGEGGYFHDTILFPGSQCQLLG